MTRYRVLGRDESPGGGSVRMVIIVDPFGHRWEIGKPLAERSSALDAKT